MAKTVDPIDQILKLHSRINERIVRAFKNYRMPYSHIAQGASRVEVEIKLPGMHKKDVELHINHRAIIIRAEKKSKKKAKSSISKEFSSYYRKIPLSPGLNISKAKARFSKETLKIKIPKKK